MADRISFTPYTQWIDVTDDNNPPAGAKVVAAADLMRYENFGRDATTLLNEHDGRVATLEQGIADASSADAATNSEVARVADRMATGEETFHILEANTDTPLDGSGSIVLSYFTARKATAVTKIGVCTMNTAAAATPTLARLGLYKVEANGNLTLVASTPNNTALFNAPNTRTEVTTSAAFTTVIGQMYAVAVLVVSTAAMPTFVGAGTPPALSGLNSPHRPYRRRLTGQADLPASITLASLTDSTTGGPIFAWLKP